MITPSTLKVIAHLVVVLSVLICMVTLQLNHALTVNSAGILGTALGLSGGAAVYNGTGKD